MRFYVNASFNSDTIPDWLKKDKNALAVLNRNGYDLHNLTLNPKKTGKLDENLVIYYIHDDRSYSKPDFVWIPGLYNDDHSMRNPYNGDWTAVKYIAKKNLDIKGLCYAVKEENRKSDKERYLDPRYDYDRYNNSKQRYMGQYKDRGTWSTKGRRTISWDDSTARDKSGYEIPKPEDRIANYYSGASDNLRKKVNVLYDSIVDLKEDIFSMDVDTFFNRKNLNGYSTPGSLYSSIYSDFSNLVVKYKTILTKIDSLNTNNSQYDEATNKRIHVDATKDILEKMKDLERRIANLRRLI